MSIYKSTERPSWAVDTDIEGGGVIFRGRVHELQGFSAHIVDDGPSDADSRPDVAVRFQNGASREDFYVPVARLDELIDILSQVRGSVSIRPESGEVVARDSAGA